MSHTIFFHLLHWKMDTSILNFIKKMQVKTDHINNLVPNSVMKSYITLTFLKPVKGSVYQILFSGQQIMCRSEDFQSNKRKNNLFHPVVESSFFPHCF